MSDYERLNPVVDVDHSMREPVIAGLPVGEVRYNTAGKAQVYFGGETIEHLTSHDTANLRDGAVQVEMFTIDGRDGMARQDVDYAVITIKAPVMSHSFTQRAIARRTGGGKPIDYVERTPVQQFESPRVFLDIPISGRARWLAVDPEGNFSEGLFSELYPEHSTYPPSFGEGWTFVWIAEGTFTFGELCSPRFIDETADCPSGEAGITEVISPEELSTLPEAFQYCYALYTSGEHLRHTDKNRERYNKLASTILAPTG